MGDYKDQKRALAEAAPPPRIDLGVFNNEQSTSLINNQKLEDDDQPPPYPGVTPRRPPSPIQTRWFKFKNKYLTARNGLIAGGVIFGLILVIILYNLVIADDGRKYLAYEKTSLGYFRNYNLKISFDESNNLILLSRQLGSHVDIERFALDQKQNGFIRFRLEQKQVESTSLKNCVQLADNVMCCDKTSPFSGVHCHLTQDGQDIESSAKFFHNFSGNWQSLEDGRKLLPVQNRQHHFTILDLKENIAMKIDRALLPSSHKPMAYFFSMDTYAELAELVKIRDKEFRICDYVPDNQHNYLLKDEPCRETNFTISHEHPKIKFCDNPLYSAVLQYGNRENEPDMEWVLQVKIEQSEEPYYVVGEDVAPLHQVAMNCRDESIDMYIPGRHELYQYSILLPNELNYD
ncbi:hypothetical protein QR680_008322 [Steinernema hermaphroditum]|uniref:Uncharacterized protein n=1 Tax=Steinernema hermaphroditum TaxID=289476 RepID=A0AA39IG70_9BILA|nr:hypothetical protein QR680_008322 [Steinernema hermaphroditum]